MFLHRIPWMPKHWDFKMIVLENVVTANLNYDIYQLLRAVGIAILLGCNRGKREKFEGEKEGLCLFVK